MKRPHRPLPTLEYITSKLRYDSRTGKCYRKSNGNEITYRNAQGYIMVNLHNVPFLLHRIVYYMFHRIDPLEFEIDHRNCCQTDNRIKNLRLATRSQNVHNMSLNKNNQSGIKGVCWSKEKAMWRAYVTLNRKQKHLGYFRLKEHAEESVKNYRPELHKEFHNHG